MGGCWQAEHRRGLFEHHNVIAGGAYMAELPEGLAFARSWDWAYSDDEGADATASVKGALHSEPIQGAEDLTRDTLYLVDATTARLSGLAKKRHVRGVALRDSVEVTQYFEQEPAAGKELSEDYRLEVFAGMDAHARRPQGDKTVRAKRWLALTETTPARVILVRNPDGTVPDWHHDVLDQLAHFPDRPRDLIDAISQLYSALKSKVWATW
jgi:phage terminase large subunit-like protein